MKIEKIADLSQVEQLLSLYKKRGGFSNNYLLVDEYNQLIQQQKLFYIVSSSNLCFLEMKETCMRVYYHINDVNEYISFPKHLSFALEILYRGDQFYPSKEVTYWHLCGFQDNLVRDLYEAKFENPLSLSLGDNVIDIRKAESRDEASYVRELFNSTFDIYTGDYLSTDIIKDLLKNKQLYIAYYESQRAGALHAYINANKVWLGHLAVDELFRGNHIGSSLLNRFIRDYYNMGYIRFALWVQRNNIPAVSMYKSVGFSYKNKSTLSMLNLQTN